VGSGGESVVGAAAVQILSGEREGESVVGAAAVQSGGDRERVYLLGYEVPPNTGMDAMRRARRVQ